MTKKETYEYTEKRLSDLQDEMFKAEKSTWFVPKCPECEGVLSQKFMSTRLVCLKCGVEFNARKAVGVWKPTIR